MPTPQSDNNLTEGNDKDKGKNSTRTKSQCDLFRCRINNDAKAMMEGRWEAVRKPYKPVAIKDEKSTEWRSQASRQEKMNAWVAAARKPSKETGSLEESRYRVIMQMRKDSAFAYITKKYPEPPKPASMTKKPEPGPAPPAPAPATLPIALPVTLPFAVASSSVNPAESLKRKEFGINSVFKQEIIDVDDDDEQPEPEHSDYEPEEDAVVKREERAKKRQRTGDFTTQLKLSANEEDLQYQLEEAKLKAQLQEVQIRRKMAALRRREEAAK